MAGLRSDGIYISSSSSWDTQDAVLCIETEAEKKNRGNYRCSRCNLPKKGHVCPYQPRFRKKEACEMRGSLHLSDGRNCHANCFCVNQDESVQVEVDPEMTVAALGSLDLQGLPESYLVQPEKASAAAAFPC
eukprot:gene6621-7315_t